MLSLETLIFQFQKVFSYYFIDDFSSLFSLLPPFGTPAIWLLNLLGLSSNFLIFSLLFFITFCPAFWEISTYSFRSYCFSICTLVFLLVDAFLFL